MPSLQKNGGRSRAPATVYLVTSEEILEKSQQAQPKLRNTACIRFSPYENSHQLRLLLRLFAGKSPFSSESPDMASGRLRHSWWLIRVACVDSRAPPFWAPFERYGHLKMARTRKRPETRSTVRRGPRSTTTLGAWLALVCGPVHLHSRAIGIWCTLASSAGAGASSKTGERNVTAVGGCSIWTGASVADIERGACVGVCDCNNVAPQRRRSGRMGSQYPSPSLCRPPARCILSGYVIRASVDCTETWDGDEQSANARMGCHSMGSVARTGGTQGRR